MDVESRGEMGVAGGGTGLTDEVEGKVEADADDRVRGEGAVCVSLAGASEAGDRWVSREVEPNVSVAEDEPIFERRAARLISAAVSNVVGGTLGRTDDGGCC